MQSAAKVGMLLIVFICLFFGGYMILGKNLLNPPVDHYFADLADASGVDVGTRVQMAGVDIGVVTAVGLKTPTLARVSLGIKPGTRIPSGSQVMLPTSLIGFGDTPITIVPPAVVAKESMHPGETLLGKKSSPLDGILPEAHQTIAELNKTMVAVRKLLEDQKLQHSVNDLLTTTNKTLEHFGALASQANTLLASNQVNIGKAISAATSAIQDVHRVTSEVARLVQSGKLQNNAVAIMERVKKISESADDLVKSMDKMVNDPKLRDPISRTASNVADITGSGKEIANNTAQITKNGITISENAAVVSQKAIVMADKATEVITKASAIEDQLKGVIDKVGGFFNKAPSGKDIPKITSEMSLARESRPGYWRTDLGFSVPLSDSTLHLGVYDAFESNRLTVELSKPVNSQFAYRYGIYASKPGIGVDFRLAPRVTLTGDAWDINSPRLDLRAGYEIGNGLVGWIGFDRMLKDNALTLGVGIRR